MDLNQQTLPFPQPRFRVPRSICQRAPVRTLVDQGSTIKQAKQDIASLISSNNMRLMAPITTAERMVDLSRNRKYFLLMPKHGWVRHTRIHRTMREEELESIRPAGDRDGAISPGRGQR